MPVIIDWRDWDPLYYVYPIVRVSGIVPALLVGTDRHFRETTTLAKQTPYRQLSRQGKGVGGRRGGGGLNLGSRGLSTRRGTNTTHTDGRTRTFEYLKLENNTEQKMLKKTHTTCKAKKKWKNDTGCLFKDTPSVCF